MVAEVALIVVGLAGAFAVDEWREDHAQRTRAAAVLERIATEIRRNRDQIEGLVDYHTDGAAALQPLAERALAGGAVTYEELAEALPRLFATPLLSSSAWELAKSTGVLSVVELEVADGLARLYDDRAFLQGRLDRIGSNVYEAGNQQPRQHGGAGARVPLAGR